MKIWQIVLIRLVLALAVLMAAASAKCQSQPGNDTNRICYRGSDVDSGSPLHFLRVFPCDQIPIVKSFNNARVIEAYKPRRNPFKVLYDIHQHPHRTTVIWMIGAGIAGGLIAWETRAHCENYEAGHNGVNVNCVKEVYPAGSK